MLRRSFVSFLILTILNLVLSPTFAVVPDIVQIRQMLRVQSMGPGDSPSLTTELPKETEVVEKEKDSVLEMFMCFGIAEAPALSQFGYDIFRRSVSTFAPRENIPVTPDYIIGPDDSFTITLWGISEGVFRVSVDREGMITLPKAGVISVAGVRFGNLERHIANTLRPFYQEINVSVAMGKMRSIRVYVLGEVRKPGSYTLSALSTTFNALYSCGGPSKKGSLRKIKLIRGRRQIARVDLYDFLLYGKKEGDRQLQDGDIIFVPLIGEVVGVAGNVARPAIYEINGKGNLKDVIGLAGGFLPTSYLNRVQLQRVNAHQRNVVEDLNIAKTDRSLADIVIKNMDLVQVFSIYLEVENLVYLEGAVKYSGTYEFKEGMKVSDLISSRDALLFKAYLDRAEVVRIKENGEGKVTEVISFNLKKALAGDGSENLLLKRLDKVVVHAERESKMEVTISGELNIPGKYAINEGESLSSLIKRAGGFTDKAFLFGTVFIRESAKSIQQTSFDKMLQEMEKRIVLETSMRASSPEEAMILNERYMRSKQLLEKLRKTQAKGRVIVRINNPENLADTADDIVLEDGDSIDVPQQPSVVSVLGEVYDSSSILYEEGKQASYYIEKVGGLNKQADRGSVYVLRGDGSVLSSDRYNVFNTEMLRGDTIIVPQKFEIAYNWGKGFMDTLDVIIKFATAYALVLAVTK